jgi:hypothetical protein
MSDIEADPKNTASYRVLRAVVIVLGVLIVIAVGALVVGLATTFGGHGRPARGAAPTTFVLAAGAKIVSMDTQPGRLLLRIRTSGGEEIDIIDIQDGHLVGQVKVAAGK